MTPAEKEAQAVNEAYQQAYVQYGAAVALEVVATWEAVNRFTPSGKTMLLATIATKVLAGRTAMARLAVRRTQLVNALRKGRQLTGSADDAKTLQDLRDALTESLREVGAPRAKRALSLDPGEVIPVSAQAGSVGGLVEEINDHIDSEIDNLVKSLGDGRLGKIARREGVVTPKDVRTSRNLVASGAERQVLNGARETDAKILKLNKDVMAYVRIHSHSDEPCPFCTMLMSRGPVYHSSKSAEGIFNEATDEWEQYHFNCHCSAHPVYSYKEWMNDPMFADNRMYQQEWNRVIKGQYYGDEALPAWRQHVKRLSEARGSAAQAAA